jgi:nicotinamide riboside transporter PnuC
MISEFIAQLTWHDLCWILVAIALAGNVLVIKKSVMGQWFWTVSNTGFVIYDLAIHNYSQAFLFFIYLGMSIWGITLWTKEAAAKKAAEA